ncbi:MAG: hypothetical protein C0410_02745 [Anaerolinea sp.]|nr:hypothetical protein [Anaerolinea sp.]
MEDYWFVDEDWNISEGEAAKEILEKNSDAKFLTEDNGIIQVSRERWKIAQQFEKIGWMEKRVGAQSDRNIQHMGDFDQYACLKGLSFEHAIELGCGPFTNLRLIGQVCRVKTCSLLDPLIESYLKLPNRAYDTQMLNCRIIETINSSNRFLIKGIRMVEPYIPPVLKKKIPISSIFPTSIEEMPTDGKYDLIIIINVIEHCYDINLVFDNILKISSPNTILVFHDKYYDYQQVNQLIQGHYFEAGHPLLVDRKVIDKFLLNFKPLFQKVVVGKEKTHIPYEKLFYIGKL